MKSEEIEEKIKYLKEEKRKLEYIESKKPVDINELIYIKYIEYESVVKVAQFVNDMGYRFNNRKYITNDISGIIKQKDLVNDLWMDNTAKKIYKKNIKIINQIYN